MNRFVDSFGISLFDIDFSLLFTWSYLTETNPESFAFSGWLTLLVVANLLVMSVLFVLNKRKAIVIIGKRKIILKKTIKLNIVFSLVWLSFIIFRHQGIEYLSMRIWQLIFLIIFFIGNFVALTLFFRASKTKADVVTNKTDGMSNYQEYLPKKGKKKKR